ncbi:uncharacterized protein KD926_005510 [Aspergillus affinis]|uniref:uncharacterized protein n=1 Tax=Aspergillus affinis TaxID=1070780 RepID=UPI0022FEE948|nr:uncharacterized protein KD926_005510 [Aspergillus affinis]KAI9042432.1 hypothetical protein KD926_005510 [Aspergillus affinis]
MATPSEMMNEKTDLERSSREPVNPEILNPLLFLLASRRGVRNDERFAETAVSDDYIMRYQGQFMIVFCMFNMGYVGSDMIDHKSEDPEYKLSMLYSHLRIGAYTALLTTFLLLAAKRYAKRLAAAAMPPQYDPTFYQYRLTSALEERCIEYREIITANTDEMNGYWNEQPSLCERFRILGLVDPEQASHVYDVVVRFYNNGHILMQFPAADPTAKRPIVTMLANTSS